ncbi:MAG: serine hydrolase domain-containing protein [Bacteroidota bacterium]
MTVKINIFCVKVSAVLIFLLFFQGINAQYNFVALDQKLEASKKDLGGAVVTLIYKDGKLIYQKAIGEFTAKAQAPIVSSSKWLTAALVMSFVDQGKLSLDDKVSKYIPLFAKYSKGYITIRDCLSHMTGIEADPNILKKATEHRSFSSLEDEVIDFASKKNIQTNPGLEFRYSNIGLNIAARIVEIVGRRGFEQLMQERITRPLLMRNTSFSSFDAVNPSDGAISTANDYMNFLVMILNKGEFNGKRILSEKSINEMHTLRTNSSIIKLTPKIAEGFNYGLGEWIQDTDENGKATVVSCPSLFGTWPMVDLCRGYACIVFPSGILKDSQRGLYKDIKSAIDEQIAANCK